MHIPVVQSFIFLVYFSKNYDWRSFRQFFDRFILSNLDFMPALKFSLIFSNDVLIVMFKNKNILFRENSIYIGSAVFAGLPGVPDRQTCTETTLCHDVCSSSPHFTLCMRCGLIMVKYDVDSCRNQNVDK